MVAIRKPLDPSAGPRAGPEVIATPLEIYDALASRDETAATVHLLRPLRRDALPEHTRYVDTGCEVHSSCLACPLVRCRYDDPGGARAVLGQERDRSILAMRREGRPIRLIAQHFAVSRRTVFRVLAAARGQVDNG